MDTTTRLLTGLLPFALIASALLTYPIARVLLFFYKRSIRRSMETASNAPETSSRPAVAARPAVALSEIEIDADRDGGALYAQPWKAAAVYAAAGALFASVFTAAYLLSMGERTIYPVRTLFLFWVFFWPAVLAISVVVATTRRRVLLFTAYFAVLTILVIAAQVRSPSLGWLALPFHWLTTAGVPTLVTAAYLARRVRTIGPLVLTFVFLAITGSLALVSIVNEHAWPALASAAGRAFEAGLGAQQVFWILLIVPMIVFAFLGWYLLKWIARQYERKRFSDETLTVESIVLLFAVAISISLTFAGTAYFFTGLVAFAAFKTATYAGFALTARKLAPRRLLLLRVFALGKHSERLFDVVRAHWLRIGGMTLIAGPDLISSTFEPHEFFRFLAGDAGGGFVTDEADLNRRVAQLDSRPDPDGRYRVDEFFCRTNTWRPTMRALAARSDAVLMDLRGFTQENEGCLFELGELLNLVDLERIVLVIDRDTHRDFLSWALHDRWSRLSGESINRKYSAPQVCIVEVPKTLTTRAIRRLLSQLYAGCPAGTREERARTAPMISSAR